LKYHIDTKNKKSPAAKYFIRCKEYEMKQINATTNGVGFPFYLKRDEVIRNYLNEDRSLVFEVEV
jgi:hypothetical protein